MYMNLGTGQVAQDENGESYDGDEIKLSKCTCTCQRGEKENIDEIRDCMEDETNQTRENKHTNKTTHKNRRGP